MSTTTGPDAVPTPTVGPPTTAPGWHPDPFAPSDPTRCRWWDGQQWGSTRRWDGAAWVDEAPVAPSGAPRRRRGWFWALVVAGVVVVLAGGCGVLLLIGVGLDEALTHDLIDTDFATGPDPFEVGSSSEAGPYTFAVEDGSYVITATGDGDNSTVALGDFARVAYTVDVTTTVSGLAPGTSAALSCSGTEDPLDGYYLEVAADGASLLRQENGTATVLAEASEAVVDEGVHELGLSCHQSLPNPTDQTLTATIDGEEVLTAQEGDPAVDGYGYAGLGFWSEASGQRVEFGDVVAHVPE